MSETVERKQDILALTAQIVTAYLAGNRCHADSLPSIITSVHGRLLSSLDGAADAPARKEPAVAPNESVTDEYIICLEDGLRFKSMRGHLAKLGLTPSQYRAKWGLAYDYPMVALAYSKRRSEMARGYGLGRSKHADANPASAPEMAS